MAVQDDALRSHEEIKFDFLSYLSHNIRTPLNAILSFSNQEVVQDADEAKLREYLHKINCSGEFLLGIVNDMLDMSRIEHNVFELHPAQYHLKEFIASIRSVIGRACEYKNITFTLDTVYAGSEIMQVDQLRINQIFLNLLSNAVKFTPEGGEIRFTIEESCYNNRPVKRFIVCDNGIGMSPEFIPYAFESFYQEQRHRGDANGQEAGLGLAIVKELVDLMNGKIELKSELNRGTTFIVEIPVTGECESEECVCSESDEYFQSLIGKRILIVEDNPLNMEITVTLLQKKGCIVDCAENGRVACEIFEAYPTGYYDMIYMDIRMPVMDGITAACTIRSMKRQDAVRIPIIAMSADVFNEKGDPKAREAINNSLLKPVVPHELYEMCRKYLS